MNLCITPQTALVDEKIEIRLTQLSPNEKVKITASMHFPWAVSEKYQSYAYFTADENGEIDLSKQKPDSGTYDWVDRMGLIISMQKVSSKNANIAEGLTIKHDLLIDFCVEHQGGIESKTIERQFQKPQVKSHKIHNPFIGELFYTGNPDAKTIVLLGGSDGGIAPLALIAAPLASHGFNVLSVGYFGEEGLPEHLQNIPLEYFEAVLNWIKENPDLSSDEIYLHGTSKGGELALLLASKYNEISKVVANMPHAYCFEGLKGMLAANTSSWSQDGKPLPYIKLDNNVFFEEQKKSIIKNEPFGVACCYKKGLESTDNKEEARIKIENAKADLLLISDEKDMIWNSYDGCCDIVKVLESHQYPHSYTLLSYEEMGHTSLPIPYIIPISESLHMEMGGGIFSVGGTLEGNAYGQQDSWIKTIKFLKQ